MLLLALDTATLCGSVAVVRGEAGPDAPAVTVLGRAEAIVTTHSDMLLGLVAEALRQASLAPGALEAIACGAGPGSFTGLRVALSAIKGIALARNLPLAGVSTLEALAWNLPFANRWLVPMLDARKFEVYAGVFESAGGTVTRVQPDVVTPPEAFLTALAATGRDVVFLGDGATAYRELVERLLGARARVADGSHSLPHAGNVARLAMPALLRGHTPETEAAAIVPTYLRRPEAEFKRLGQQPDPVKP